MMGFLDSLRGRRRQEPDEPVELTAGGASESGWFKPRTDGIYASQTGGHAAYLRFTASGRVQQVATSGGLDQARTALAAAGDHRADGEFTGGGVLAVSRRFERPVCYTILDVEASQANFPVDFQARCTDTNTRETSTVKFSFEPDTPAH